MGQTSRPDSHARERWTREAFKQFGLLAREVPPVQLAYDFKRELAVSINGGRSSACKAYRSTSQFILR